MMSRSLRRYDLQGGLCESYEGVKPPRLRRTQKGCDDLQEDPGAFLIAGPMFLEPASFPEKLEKNKGGWKTQWRGKHTIKPLTENGFGTPHL